MSTTRNDSHSPSNIIPADYQFVGLGYHWSGAENDVEIARRNQARIEAHMARTGGNYSQHEHGGFCHVCGSVNLIYGIIFYHAKSNAYIKVGEDCAAKLAMGGTHEMSAFRKEVRAQIEAQAGKRKAQTILAEAGLSRAYEIYAATERTGFAYEEFTITDIVSKLVRYGSISVNQGAFIGRLIAKIDERVVKAAARQAEDEAAADFPITEDRIEITGTILSTKLQESQFGSVLKMLVKAEAGWKLWITCPGNCEKGDKVRFFAKVQPSGNDPKFGFGSRPTKLTVIEEAAQAVS